MRIVFNVISYVVPSVGIVLAFWATFQLDLPVPLALIFVSLAWVYCLVLVVLTVSTGRRDQQFEDVWLEIGIIESIDHSQDSIEIKPLVGNERQRFSASQGTVGQLIRNDSVIFAYVSVANPPLPHPNVGSSSAVSPYLKIICMAKVDTSTPDRIRILGSGELRREEPESTVRIAKHLLRKEDLYNQAMIAAFVPGAFTAVMIAIFGYLEWGWGWPGWVPFSALAVIWITLTFVAGYVQNKYGVSFWTAGETLVVEQHPLSSDDPGSGIAPASENYGQAVATDLRYRVSPNRVLLMIIISNGLYLFYWMYLTWKQYRDHTREEVYPVWHALTGLVPIYGLFRLHAHGRVYKELMTSGGGVTTIDPGWLVGVVVARMLLTAGIGPPGVSFDESSQFTPILITLLDVLAIAMLGAVLREIQGNLNSYWHYVSSGRLHSARTGMGEIVLAVIGVLLWFFYFSTLLGDFDRLGQ